MEEKIASREKFLAQTKIKYEQSIQEWKDFFNSKQECEWLDEDGYPTEDALELIEKWHFNDAKGWFDFIHNIWYMSSWRWGEKEDKHDFYEDRKVYRYNVSTAGWSGNEGIIRAMERNSMMWHLNWVQSRRGGHYIFELYEFNDE